MFVLNIYIFIHHFFMIKFVKYLYKKNFPGYGTVPCYIVLLNAVLLHIRFGSGMIFSRSKFGSATLLDQYSDMQPNGRDSRIICYQSWMNPRIRICVKKGCMPRSGSVLKQAHLKALQNWQFEKRNITYIFISGAPVANPRPPGEQQLCRREHQHRARGLGVVRGAGLLLGRPPGALREEQGGLPPRLLVAQHGGSQGMQLTASLLQCCESGAGACAFFTPGSWIGFFRIKDLGSRILNPYF